MSKIQKGNYEETGARIGRLVEKKNLAYGNSFNESCEMGYNESNLARLEEIKFDMLELIEEARELVRGTSEEDRAEAYWLPRILKALTNEHGRVGNMRTMEDAIDGIRDVDLEEEK